MEPVAEEPEPIVKLVDTRQGYWKNKEHAEQAKKSEEKEVQMSWSIAGGDLLHKSKKVREALHQQNNSRHVCTCNVITKI